MNILIYNNYDYHYEIIESIIEIFLKKMKKINIDDYLIYLNIFNNESFINYITNKYTNIKINDDIKNINFEYKICATFYDENLNKIKKDII